MIRREQELKTLGGLLRRHRIVGIVGERLGFEVKRTTSPKLTPSMGIALSDLRLGRLDVIHAGEETFPMGEKTRAVALGRLYSTT